MSRAHDGGGRDAARASACLAKRAKQQRHAGAFPHTCMSRCGFVFKHECSGLDDDNFLLPPPHEQKNLLVLGTSAVQPEQRGQLL